MLPPQMGASWRARIPTVFELLGWMHNFHYRLYRWPYYSREFVVKLEQMRPKVDARELAQYETFTRNHPIQMWLAVAVHMVFVLKMFPLVWYTMSSVNFVEPAANVRFRVWTGEPGEFRHKFLCLETNCSRLTLEDEAPLPARGGAWNELAAAAGGREEEEERSQEKQAALDSDARLADDLIKLPVFALCKPHLRAYLNPLMYTHIFGLITIATLSFFIFMICGFVPVFSYFTPMHSAITMEMLCPQIAARLMNARIRAHFDVLRLSRRNYEAHCASQAKARATRLKFALADDDLGSCFGHLQQLNCLAQAADDADADDVAIPSGEPNGCILDAEEGRRRSARPCLWRRRRRSRATWQNLSARLSERVRDCLPVQQSEWFRLNWTRAYLSSVALQLTFLFAGLSLYLRLVFTDETYAQLYRSYARLMERDQCQLWRATGGSRERVDLSNLVEAWTPLQAIVFVLAHALIVWLPSVCLTLYYYATNFLVVMIVDLNNQLRIALELGELLSVSKRLNGGGAGADWARVSEHFKLPGMACDLRHCARQSAMRQIRGRIRELVHPNFMLIRSNKPRRLDGRAIRGELEERLASQEFARHIISCARNSFDLDAYVDLLEKLHVNYWLFMETLRDHDGPVTSCHLFSYILNYGFALLGLYQFKSFGELVVAPLILSAIALIIGNGFICLSSNVHAKARRLELKLWSLIATTTRCRDLRVRHLRHLWVKQLDLIDGEGGLALKMFGRINVTYVGIIQYGAWTATLMVLAYR